MIEFIVGAIAIIIILFFIWFVGYVTLKIMIIKDKITYQTTNTIKGQIAVGIITILCLVMGSMLLMIGIALIRDLGKYILGLM